MEYIKKVNNLVLDGNLTENWRRFKQNYDIFEEAAGISTKPEKVRIASFLNAIGEEAVELFNSFKLSEKDRKVYESIKKAFEDHCTPKKRTVSDRFLFFSRNQAEGETFETFLADIEKLSSTCSFENQRTSMMRDRILLGITNKKLQAKMLEENDLSFDKAVELCRAAELCRATKLVQGAGVQEMEPVNDNIDEAKHSKYDDRGDDISEKSTAQCADLYVAGLPWNTTEKMFRKYFEKFGKVKIAKIMKNIETGTSRGFGFIRFDLYECEMKALSSSHIIDGRRCSVTYARMLAGSVAKFNQFPRDIKNHTGKGNSVFVSNAMRKSIKNKCNNGDGENTQQICVYGGCDIGENDKIQSALPDDDNMSNYDYPPMPYNNDNSDLPTLQSIEINEKNPFL